MSGTATLAEAFVHQVAGPIATSVATIIGVILSLHRVSDAVRITSTATRVGVQRRAVTTKIQRLPVNQTSLVHSTSLLTHTYDGGLDLPAPVTAAPSNAADFGSVAGAVAVITPARTTLAGTVAGDVRRGVRARSRVQQTRTYGLKGGWGNKSAPRTPRP
jgi:hypothetical protein